MFDKGGTLYLIADEY